MTDKFLFYVIIALLAVNVIISLINMFKKNGTKSAEDSYINMQKNIESYVDKNTKSTLDFLERQQNQQIKNQQQLNVMENARFSEFSNNTQINIETLRKTVIEMMSGTDKRFVQFQEQSDRKLNEMRETLEKKVGDMQTSNEKKLDEIRGTVDEKLQKTLDDKFNQSFKLVSERLQQVYEGLGEMKNVAGSVGDLKKVLSNVKTRGILGEIQLGAILEQILSKEQYEENIVTKKGSLERVEFAVKLPGENGKFVYLPIDAKFPLDAYQELLDAYETSDAKQVEEAAKVLITRIKGFAKDIRTKYIDVPNTTDFAIMFLPVEGLYAEVVRRGMVETLQNDYHINIAGPTTMAALLNSLQMGFKTLAIQKRSGEVWEVLGGVKTEFDKFEKVLEQLQKRMNMASNDLEALVGVRTRSIQRKLRGVDEYLTDDQKIKNIEE